ncbi:unnamed protein product [Staurois parvus]|uniref:Uncharacterized protein n=1 Tax=Staurois parvus TaxID=386267 RepID=A0ABN9GMZ8_9NEOB|nr:unnamed protein product [Staurois parvus]
MKCPWYLLLSFLGVLLVWARTQGPGTFFIGFFEGGLTIWKLGHCPRARGQ